MKQEIIYVLFDVKEQEIELYHTEEEAINAYEQYDDDNIQVMFYFLNDHIKIDKTESFKKWFRR